MLLRSWLYSVLFCAPPPFPSPSCWGPSSSNAPLTRVRTHSTSASTTGNCGNTSSTSMRHKKSEVRAAGAMRGCLYTLVQTLQLDNNSPLFCIHLPTPKYDATTRVLFHDAPNSI
uniref:Uncharacterized protein n=1 Tax=Terrapene triunguis TaxID=2587831 RepID=A0A674IQR4_9SAUR